MTFRKVKGNFERLFDKNLTDLVRGIRNNRENEAKYIAQCMEEIKEELRQDNLSVKANAVAKLTYLQMLGYDISWAAFNVIEVMSSTKFTHKRIGYLCASQSFYDNTDVMMLTTNMIRKDLNSQTMYDAGCAMSGLACFVSTDLSRDLANDVMVLLSSTKPYLRKKAVLLMYKVFLKYPDALKPSFPRLKEKLEDPDPGVQSAAVNVICELARKNPRNYLPLAPVFFKLMTNSTNNWMLIKIIKLFGSLTPLEPRLGKKLIEPLTNLIHSTSAMSLLYECINTVIAVLISISSGLPNHNASIQLCVQKLRILIEDSDQNLKYLGLLAMSKILKTHPKSVQAHKDLVLSCLEDKDESIRLRALDLLYGMVSKKNLMEIVKKLMNNVSENPLGNKYRDELIAKIIDICSQNDYQLISNFEWYISVLVDLSRVQGGSDHGSLIAQQMLDVAIRVETIRPFAAEQMAVLLDNCSLFANNTSVCEVLFAAAWICGEFSNHLPNKKIVLFALMPRVRFLSHIEASFLLNAAKIFVEIASELTEEDIRSISDRLSPYISSEDLEVQERANNFLNLLQQQSLFHSGLFKSYPLNPVAAKAQKKVPVPPGLDLDIAFVALEEDTLPSEDPSLGFSSDHETQNGEKKEKKKRKGKKSKEEKKSKKGKKDKKKKDVSKEESEPTKSDIQEPVTEVAEEVVIKTGKKSKVSNGMMPSIPGLASSDRFVDSPKKSKKKKKKAEEEEEEEVIPAHTVTIKGLEMPEGAEDDDANSEDDTSQDPDKALAKVVLDPVVYEKPVSPTGATTSAVGKKKKTKKSDKKLNGGSVDKTDDKPVDKKEKKKKSKKRKEEVQAPAREEYEETEETVEGTEPLISLPKNQFHELTQNDELTVLFSNLSLNPLDNSFDCSLKIESRQSDKLPDVEISWDESDRVKECESSVPEGSSSAQLLRLKIQSPSIEASSLSGTIKYSIEEASHELSVVLPIPLSCFVRKPETDQPVSEVVTQLTSFSSLIIEYEGGLNKFLQKLIIHIQFKVTDQIEEEAATLQGTLGNEDHFCFLIKSDQDKKSISVNGRAKNEGNLNAIMNEIKALFTSDP